MPQAVGAAVPHKLVVIWISSVLLYFSYMVVPRMGHQSRSHLPFSVRTTFVTSYIFVAM